MLTKTIETGMNSATPPQRHTNQTVDLRDRRVATFLAWLIPGLGHLYQRRYFKAVLYSVCILGTFFSGVCLGDGKVVYWNWKQEQRTYGYLAQVFVGLPALPAIIQTRRQPPDQIAADRHNLMLDRSLAGEFEGTAVDLRVGSDAPTAAHLIGKIQMKPAASEGFERRVEGSFQGVIRQIPGERLSTKSDATVELSLTILRDCEPRVYPSRHQEITCEFEGKVLDGTGAALTGTLSGQIRNSRSLMDSYAAPLDEKGMQDAHGNLGKFFELGAVYTWIAGFLNLLAMWDALEGPANGYRDDEPMGEPDPVPPAA